MSKGLKDLEALTLTNPFLEELCEDQFNLKEWQKEGIIRYPGNRKMEMNCWK
jgi:hypothetical protein